MPTPQKVHWIRIHFLEFTTDMMLSMGKHVGERWSWERDSSTQAFFAISRSDRRCQVTYWKEHMQVVSQCAAVRHWGWILRGQKTKVSIRGSPTKSMKSPYHRKTVCGYQKQFLIKIIFEIHFLGAFCGTPVGEWRQENRTVLYLIESPLSSRNRQVCYKK